VEKNEQSYYLDASSIIAYFKEEEEIHRDFLNEINRLIMRKKQNPQIKIKIPSIALAEILNKFLADSDLINKINELKKLFEKLEADFPSPKKDDFERVLLLMQEDEYLRNETHDALFIAQMLNDTTTKWVYTTDNLIAKHASSNAIKVYPEKRRQRKK